VTDAWVGLLVVRQAIQERELTPARLGAARRHVSRLVPLQHRCGAAQVVDLLQPRLERGEFGVASHQRNLIGRLMVWFDSIFGARRRAAMSGQRF
jgi:hypothetical protein